MNYLKILFNKNMFLVTLVLLLIYNFALMPNGINKTISWNPIDKFAFYFKWYFDLILLIYTIGYSFLAISKKNTLISISVIHTIIISISLFVINSVFDEIIFLINILSIILFITNLIFSIKMKEIKSKN